MSLTHYGNKLQHFEHGNADQNVQRNNVRFLPETATYPLPKLFREVLGILCV